MVLWLGPRVSLDSHYLRPQLPQDLDEYLRKREANFNDITPGAEKKIVWADESEKEKTAFAFVYLHGFSATRQESAPVPTDIAQHFGSNIYFARLAGNGRSDDAMAQGSVNKWVNDAAEALAIAERIGHQTIVIGCSTGASLAWWAAHQNELNRQIAALVFFSPNFGVADQRAELLLYPWGAQLARLIVGKYRQSEAVNEQHERYWTTRYPTVALLPMMGMVKLANRYAPANCELPVHITYAPHDDTVSIENVKAFIDKLPANSQALEIVQPEDASQHVIVGDILAPENNQRVTHAVIQYLEQTLNVSQPPNT